MLRHIRLIIIILYIPIPFYAFAGGAGLSRFGGAGLSRFGGAGPFSFSCATSRAGRPPGRAGAPADTTLAFFKADHPYIRYTGRVDFSHPGEPRFWAPGVYIQVRFEGPACLLVLKDEVLYGTSHNYLEIAIEGEKPYRVQTKGKTDTLRVIFSATKGPHTLTITKDTESGIGYLAFCGISCQKLLPPPAPPSRKIEFIGNSITCGTGSDLSLFPCGQGAWYDQHNAYLSYGPTTARRLNAQWTLSSVSGIGLIHSCCDMTITMPPVFDKVNMRSDSILWDFHRYQPDVVTVCLGQNDGVQDSTVFCTAYVRFLDSLRGYYPKAAIICLTSPMADSVLAAVMRHYIGAAEREMHRKGDRKVYTCFFSKQYHHGCGGHPDLEEHQAIAGELVACIKKVEGW